MKNRNKWFSRQGKTLLAAVLFSVSVGATSSDAVEFTSDAIKAANVAYADFEKRLSSRDNEGDLAAYILNPKNYSIGISQTDLTYVVVFLPKRTSSHKYLMGGGGQYQVRKSDLLIVKFLGYK